ncbi:MAG: TonB-dependent receptor [Bryobacterales bacterium]|nr:TonB-dependent receptor [Bryobacterales bacterium]
MTRLSFLLLPIVLLHAQIEQANITGTVIDSSGAAVPGAAVSIVNMQTKTRAETRSNETGTYRLPYLPAGEYQLAVEKEGFERSRVDAIRLTVGLTATVNVTLKPGSVQQEVTVSATAVQLEQESFALGNTINVKQITELPLLGRNPYNLVLLAPGVMPKGGAGAGPIINGGRSNTSEVLLDGAETRNSTTNDIAYTPPLETVQEFKVFTNGFSAEYGRSGGGVLTVATRAGTNDWHGAVYEFLRNDKLNANSWTSNRVGLARNPFRRNEFGVAVGGPVRIPKLYDGRNRTFFFFNWEKIPQRSPDNILSTVPTALERNGDFSRTTTAAGARINIYDPNTTVPAAAAGQYQRSVFPDNRIPASRFDPIAQRVLQLIPLPNRTTVVQNFVANNTRANDTDRWFFRVDQNLGSKHRLFFSGGIQGNTQFTPGINVAFPGEGVNGEQGSIGTDSLYGVISDTVTFRPNLIGQFRLSTTRRVIKTEPRSAGYDFTQLGFSQDLKNRAKTLLFPRFDITDAVNLGPDRASFFTDAEDNRDTQAQFTWVAGSHSVKAGGNFTFQTFNIFRPERPSGYYQFSRIFTQGPNPTASSATAGHGVATFLMGLPTGGTFSDDPSLATSQKFYAGYVQDDWKIRRNLTLNLGLRWEYQTPWSDRFNQLGYFDPDFTDPLTKQKGLLRFTGRDGNSRYQSDPDRNNFAPRVGLAWNFMKDTVLRAGYGMFFFPGSGGVGAGASDLGSGFLAQTPVFLGPPVAAPNTPPVGASLARSFEAGFFPAPFDGVGSSIGTAFREWVTPFNQQWNFNIQRTLRRDLLVEVAYAGSRGQRIWINRSRTAVDTQYLSLGAGLDQLVPNPYFGVITSGALSVAQVRRSQLLQPFNHYTGVSRFRDAVGDSVYHAFTMRVDKQFSRGFSFQAAYTAGKQIDNVQERFGGRSSFLDPNNLSLSRSIGEFDRPQYVVMNYIYELPSFKQGWAKHVVGRWQVTGITTFGKGLPMVITGPNNTRLPGVSAAAVRLKDPVLSADERTLDRYFDTSAFSPAPTYSLGNDSRTQPRLRTPGIKTFDLMASRTQVIKERVNVQFRAEFFNAFNTPQFDAPNGNVTATNFGQITSAGGARQIQMGIRLSF